MKGQIKEVNNLEDFKGVYQVFSGPPYNEKYTAEEVEEIFEEYKNGYIYGAYSGEKCVGIVALKRGVQKEQPVKLQGEKIMYLADVAVLEDYRKTGIGSALMLYSVMRSVELGFQKMYMRTLEPESSMSYGIARKIGFEQIPNVYQSVERQRVDGNITAVQNIFLELDLLHLNKNAVRQQLKEVMLISYIREGEERC